MAATLAGMDFDTEKAVRIAPLYVAALTALSPKQLQALYWPRNALLPASHCPQQV